MTKRTAPPGPDHAINRLRRLAEVLAIVADTDGCAAELASDAAWFAGAVRRYDEGAPAGVDLARAFGMNLSVGGTTWWKAEALDRRNQLIREARETYFADLELSDAADQIRQAAARCRRATRRPQTGPGALLAEAARFMPIPQSSKMVREILETK